MLKIIGKQGTGKTHSLLLKAKEDNAVVVCGNPEAMVVKASSYDIRGLEFWSYEDLIRNQYTDKKIYVDDIELLLNALNTHIVGFNLSADE